MERQAEGERRVIWIEARDWPYCNQDPSMAGRGTDFAARPSVSDIPADVREIIRRIGSFDHIEVLMRLYEAPGSMTQAELVASTRLGAATVAKATTDLVAANLAVRDPASGASRFDATPADREAVRGVAELYHTRPVTLVKLVYAQPSTAIQSFADAFRIVDKPRDE